MEKKNIVNMLLIKRDVIIITKYKNNIIIITYRCILKKGGDL